MLLSWTTICVFTSYPFLLPSLLPSPSIHYRKSPPRTGSSGVTRCSPPLPRILLSSPSASRASSRYVIICYLLRPSLPPSLPPFLRGHLFQFPKRGTSAHSPSPPSLPPCLPSPSQRATTAVVGSKKALEDANAKLTGDAKLDVIELL